MKMSDLSESGEKLDLKKIRNQLNSYFLTSGTVTITDQGVTVNGDVDAIAAFDTIPVKFQKIIGTFQCDNSGMTTLTGCPPYVGKNFNCSQNMLPNLTGCPEYIGNTLFCHGNPLTSLDGIAKEIKQEIVLSYNETLPMLKLFNVKSLQRVTIMNAQGGIDCELCSIFDRYLPRGRLGILPCAAELIKAGHPGIARL